MTHSALQRLWVVVLLAVTICLSSALAQSQANTGSIEGTVTDPSGRSVPGASVTVVNTDTNFTRKITTDAEGRFRALQLPLGGYKVTVTATSFGTLVRSGMDLTVGQSIKLQLTLSVAATTEVVNVSADVPVVEVSKIEHRSDICVSTLAEYIEALGGRLEIRAVFPDREVVINQFGVR